MRLKFSVSGILLFDVVLFVFIVSSPDIVVVGSNVNLGQNAALQCTVTPKVQASQVTLNWTFEGQLQVQKTFNNSQQNTYVLTHSIASTTINNAGLYECGVAFINYTNNNESPLPVKSASLRITGK